MGSTKRRLSVLAGVLGASGLCAVLAMGCSSSGSGTSPEDGGGGDSTTDSGEDVAQQGEGAADSAAGDSGNDADATLSPDGDSGVDAASPDGDASSGTDGDAEPPQDGSGEAAASDAGEADADASAAADSMDATADAEAGPSDAGPSLTAQSFPGLFNSVLCDVIANCCGTSPDAATFNLAGCYSAVAAGGYKGMRGAIGYIDSGNIAFDASAAQVCLNTITTADCQLNQITSGEMTQLFGSCYGAYTGTLEAGAPCLGTIECGSGAFCNPVDGGVGDAGAIGLCQPLAGVGGACGFLGSQTLGQTVCSYRGSATNGLFCQNISGDAGVTQIPSSQWTCQPQWANGPDCYAYQDCASRVCLVVDAGASLYQCGNVVPLVTPATCAAYVTDAGGGG